LKKTGKERMGQENIEMNRREARRDGQLRRERDRD
jgi:hypothetical protein